MDERGRWPAALLSASDICLTLLLEPGSLNLCNGSFAGVCGRNIGAALLSAEEEPFSGDFRLVVGIEGDVESGIASLALVFLFFA